MSSASSSDTPRARLAARLWRHLPDAMLVEPVIIPLAALVTAGLIFAVFLLALGKSPATFFSLVWTGGFSSWFSVQNALQRAAPLILTGLAFAIPAPIGLTLLGAEGGLVLGGLAAAVIALPLQTAGLPALLILPLMALAAMAVGAGWMGIAGWLKHARGVNETISSLLLTYIAIAIASFLIEGPFRDPASANKPSTQPLGPDLRMGEMFGTSVHWGLAAGLVLAVLLWVVMARTSFGFAARIGGGNLRAAQGQGLPVGRLMLACCAVAGDRVNATDETGRAVVNAVSLQIGAGEILGIAGVSGNGQSALVEVLAGQRPLTGGSLAVDGAPFSPHRADLDRFKVFGLPEEPLRNAVVPRMSVAENIAFRRFDKAPLAGRFGLISPARMRAEGEALIRRYNVRASSADAPIETLSGGNVQRAVLARELSGDVDVLIVANPCFGLDFASVAEIRAQIMERRDRGAAVLLISEDLDEILELSDRIAVMSEGRLGPAAAVEQTDRATIGRQMGGH